MRTTALICILLVVSQLSGQRDPYAWPFAVTSIWNMPIGSEAVYVPAQIEAAQARGMTADEDLIVLLPDAPLLDIYANYAGWDQTRDRCPAEGPLLFSAPIPDLFIVNHNTWLGLTPNSGLAVLMPDGETIRQTQPFARCTADTATSQFVPPAVNIFGEGIRGAHGGSGLSAIGGTLRLGELDEPTDTIRHTLKVNLFANRNLFYDATTGGYRWPAVRADSYAATRYGTERTSPVVTACRMGALLALPASLELDALALETVPAQILARAFQQYGAYVVDDTAWDVWALATEWSPEGRFIEEFEDAWGFSFEEAAVNTPWTRDLRKIFTALHVVDNNSPDRIGGGGTPLRPLAPPFLLTSLGTAPASQPIKIFPNPCREQVQFTDLPLGGQLEIFNTSGHRLQLIRITQPDLQMALQLPKGLYFVRVSDHQQQTFDQAKLIVQ